MGEDKPRTFVGAIVLKAPTQAETAALAQQLEWFEGTPVVMARPADIEILLATIRDQAARCGQLAERVEELERERDSAQRSAAWHAKWSKLLTPEEHLRLLDRNIWRDLNPERAAATSIVEADEHDAARLRFAAEVLELAARHIEDVGPDDPIVNLRAAEHCAAMVRGLITKHEENHG